MREKVLLICSECLARNYVTSISRDDKNMKEIKKYCKHCNKMTLHRISK